MTKEQTHRQLEVIYLYKDTQLLADYGCSEEELSKMLSSLVSHLTDGISYKGFKKSGLNLRHVFTVSKTETPVLHRLRRMFSQFNLAVPIVKEIVNHMVIKVFYHEFNPDNDFFDNYEFDVTLRIDDELGFLYAESNIPFNQQVENTSENLVEYELFRDASDTFTMYGLDKLFSTLVELDIHENPLLFLTEEDSKEYDGDKYVITQQILKDYIETNHIEEVFVNKEQVLQFIVNNTEEIIIQLTV